MTLPPNALDGYWLGDFYIPRGTCPHCGSGQVRCHIIGEPADPGAMERTPGWIVWEGCLHPGYTRSCRACRATWDEDD